MKYRKLAVGAETTFVVILDDGDEAVECLQQFARENDVTAGRFTGLGRHQEFHGGCAECWCVAGSCG